METPADPAPATPLPPPAERPRRPTRRARRGWKGWGIGGVAVAAFAAFAVWLANQDPPDVTHAEAMAMAVAIEQAKGVDEIARLVDFENPPGCVPISAYGEGFPSVAVALIAHWKDHGSYTFRQVVRDDRGTRLLLFRAHRGVNVTDYHELRLERSRGAVKVVDIWSMMHGGWMSHVLSERQATEELQAQAVGFARRIESQEDAAVLETDFRQLPDAVRSMRQLALQFVVHMAWQRPDALPSALAEFRAVHPDDLGADLVMLAGPTQAGVTREEAAAALRRIKARVGDEQFLDEVWKHMPR